MRRVVRYEIAHLRVGADGYEGAIQAGLDKANTVGLENIGVEVSPQHGPWENVDHLEDLLR